jgi:hypothetical protein
MLLLGLETSHATTEFLLSLSDEGHVLQRRRVPFGAPSCPELLGDLRWLMEDFLSDATAAAPVRAAAVRNTNAC